MEKTTFAVIGGDERNIYVKDILEADKHFVRTFAFSNVSMDICKGIESALENCKYIIGPTPFSKDGVFLNTPLYDKQIYVDDFLCKISPKQKLFAGSISKTCREMLEQFQINATDLLQKKEMTILNAIPTAEGAIKIAVENSPITIHGSRALVIGYGNIGKLLAKHLRSLGAKTYAAARRPETLSEITQNDLIGVPIADLSGVLHKMDFIFNTVPSVIIDAGNVSKIDPQTPYIELASSPYGIDVEAAKESGLNFIAAPSLPGKFSPKTTAKYIVQTVYNIIIEEELL